MDILRRDLAPISTRAWEEIDAMARETLVANLSGRKVVDVAGPFGLEHACVNLGRLSVPNKQKAGGVQFGIHQVQPLIEARVSFTLQQWELDNIERGAKDIQLDSLVEATRQMAAFEEKAIFEGFDQACIQGIHAETKGKEIPLTLDMDALVDGVSEAQARLLKEGVEGGADLIVSPEVWKFLARSTPGGTLRSIIEAQSAGKVIYSEVVKDAVLIANRGGDLELTVGQDFAIGYQNHTAEEIRLFMTESFTFRVIAPEAIVGFKVKK